jgi:AcrR family transcriptional regulator
LKKVQTGRAGSGEPAQDRRSELLGIGRALFSTRAYDELSIDQIAAQAGVATGLIYYYFGSKRGYYLAVIEEAAGELRRRVEQDATRPAAERLARGLDAYLGYVEDNPEGYRTLMAGGIGADDEVRAIVARERRRFLALIVEELAADPEATPALPIALEGWFSFIEGACLEWLDRGGLDRDAVRNLLLQTLAGALGAAAAASPGSRLTTNRLLRTSR